MQHHKQCQLLTNTSCFSIHQVSQKAGAGYKVLCSAPILVVTSFLPLDSPCQLDTILVDIKDLSEQRWVSAPCHEMCSCFGLPTHCSGPFYPYSSVGKVKGGTYLWEARVFPLLCCRVCPPNVVLWMVKGLLMRFGLETIHMLCKWDMKIMCLGFWFGFDFFPLKTQSIRLLQCQEGEGSGMKCSCWMCFHHPCCSWFALWGT